MLQNNKFIVSNYTSNNHNGKYIVFLSDYEYFSDNETKLTKWCDEHKCFFKGMIVVIPDSKTLSTFLLAWS